MVQDLTEMTSHSLSMPRRSDRGSQFLVMRVRDLFAVTRIVSDCWTQHKCVSETR